MPDRDTTAATTAPAAVNPSRSRRPKANRTRLARAAIAAVLTMAGIAALTTPAAADGAPLTATEMRIVARRLDDGRTEFGLQRNDLYQEWVGDRSPWGDRRLPAQRFFPADAQVGRWLASAPLTVPVAAEGFHYSIPEADEVVVRIVARRLASGRIEFGLQQDRTDDLWGERLLPAQRFFPTGARVGRWLASSPVTANASGQPKPPAATQFTAVDAGRAHTCGLRTNGAIACWGSDWRFGADIQETRTAQTEAPDGQFSAVSAGDAHSCGVHTDSTITCWGDNERGQADAPDGQFSAVSAGGGHSCGLRTDGTVTCWGDYQSVGDWPLFAPAEERFSAVASGGWQACGLRTDSTIVCWNDYGQTFAPDGRFDAVDSGGQHSCGLRTDGTITCWGSGLDEHLNAPEGQFSAVAAGGTRSSFFGSQHSCGLRSDGTIICWGDNDSGQADPPDGEFSAVSAGARHSCGLRTDGTITCW